MAYSFTQHWFLNQKPIHDSALNASHKRILEIGAFEGMSTVYFLDCPHTSIVVSIDPFLTDDVNTPVVESTLTTFRKNVSLSPNKHKHMHLQESSAEALAKLVLDNKKFDYILVDGSHLAHHVLVDALLAFHLIDVGGIIFFDDYKSPTLGLGPTIEHALHMIGTHRVRVLHRGYHLVCRRIS